MALIISTVLVGIYIVSHCLVLQFSIAEADNVPFISFELHGRNHVRLDGDAFLTDKNVIQLTDSTKGLYGESTSRVVYDTTIPLSNSNFATHFQFHINWTRDNGVGGMPNNGDDRLAFFMASPEFGNYFVAVEFDTSKSPWDSDNNHIRIDVNNITSVKSVPLAQRLNNCKIWDARIEYRGQENMLPVSAGSEGKIAGKLSYNISWTKFLPENVVVGFSAAAYASSESHRLISWNFTANFTSVFWRSSVKKKIP